MLFHTTTRLRYDIQLALLVWFGTKKRAGINWLLTKFPSGFNSVTPALSIMSAMWVFGVYIHILYIPTIMIIHVLQNTCWKTTHGSDRCGEERWAVRSRPDEHPPRPLSKIAKRFWPTDAAFRQTNTIHMCEPEHPKPRHTQTQYYIHQ